MFVSERSPNNIAIPNSIAVIVLVVAIIKDHNEYNRALYHHSIV